MSERSIVVRLRAEVSNFRAAMKEASAAAKETGAASEAAAAKGKGAMKSMVATARENEQAWRATSTGLMAFGTAALAGIGVAVHKFAEFDKAMSEVQASTHETKTNMGLLRQAAIDAGADTAFSAKEAAQGIDELAKAGVATTDILTGGLTGALSLAAAGSLGVGDAAEIAATALTQFKLSGKDIPHVADLLAAGAGKAQGSVQDMGMALKQAGLVSSQTGLTIEETTGGLAAFASAGLIGSDAGTSFKSMLQRLTPQSQEAQKAMDQLGISAYDGQGNFIGLAAFAGQLQEKMKGLDSESRNAAMGVIFGSDAVRAANVLYEQGATGVQGWIDAVNDAGFAASTAAIKQDNLAGDIEKLGGSMDSVFIQAGSGANDALRGLVKTAEGFVDAVGKIPAPVLNAGVAMVGAVGGAALLAGTFLKVVPATANMVSEFRKVVPEGSKVSGVLGKITRSAGLVGAALMAVSVASQAFGVKGAKSFEEVNQMVLKTAKSGSLNDLNGQFEKWDTLFGMGGPQGVNDMADAVQRMTHIDGIDNVNKFLDPIAKMAGAPVSGIAQIEERFRGLGEAMGGLVANGGAEQAAKTFSHLTAEFEKNGKGAKEALDALPDYRDALLKNANAAGVDLSQEELLAFAQGKTPARLAAVQGATEAQAAATEAAARQTEALQSGLEEIGVSASGAITNLDLFTQSLVGAGLLSLSSRDAARQYKDSLDSFSESVAKNGATLDINTAAGRANQAAFDAIASAGLASAEAMAKQTDSNGANVYSQAQIQASLKGTYTDLVNSATQLGYNAEQADAMAREVMGIPKNVKVDSWMADAARQKAEQTKQAIDAIPKNTTIRVNYENTTTNRVITINSESHIAEGPGGRGGMTRWTGGLVGFAGGGVVPGVPPMDPRKDNVFAITQHGTPYAIRSGEMIVNEPATRRNRGLLEAINAGATVSYSAPSKSFSGGYGAVMSVSGRPQGGGGAIDYGRLASLMSGGDSFHISVPKPGVGAVEIMDEVRFSQRRNSRGGASR